MRKRGSSGAPPLYNANAYLASGAARLWSPRLSPGRAVNPSPIGMQPARTSHILMVDKCQSEFVVFQDWSNQTRIGVSTTPYRRVVPLFLFRYPIAPLTMQTLLIPPIYQMFPRMDGFVLCLRKGF